MSAPYNLVIRDRSGSSQHICQGIAQSSDGSTDRARYQRTPSKRGHRRRRPAPTTPCGSIPGGTRKLRSRPDAVHSRHSRASSICAPVMRATVRARRAETDRGIARTAGRRSGQQLIGAPDPLRLGPSAIPRDHAVPSVAEHEVGDTAVQKGAEEYQVRHERNLIADGRQDVVTQTRTLLGVRNLRPAARTPRTGPKLGAQLAQFRLGMEPPARQLSLWRKIATAVPAVDAQPRPLQHKWMPTHIHSGDAEFRGPHSVVRVSGLRVTA